MNLTDFPKSTLFYLATPYSNYEGGLEKAYRDARLIAARFVKQGVAIYSPIVHSHPIARIGGIDPLDHEIWLSIDDPIMRAADALIVAMLRGWETSMGVRHEIEHFLAAGKPIVYHDPRERF